MIVRRPRRRRPLFVASGAFSPNRTQIKHFTCITAETRVGRPSTGSQRRLLSSSVLAGHPWGLPLCSRVEAMSCPEPPTQTVRVKGTRAATMPEYKVTAGPRADGRGGGGASDTTSSPFTSVTLPPNYLILCRLSSR